MTNNGNVVKIRKLCLLAIFELAMIVFSGASPVESASNYFVRNISVQMNSAFKNELQSLGKENDSSNTVNNDLSIFAIRYAYEITHDYAYLACLDESNIIIPEHMGKLQMTEQDIRRSINHRLQFCIDRENIKWNLGNCGWCDFLSADVRDYGLNRNLTVKHDFLQELILYYFQYPHLIYKSDKYECSAEDIFSALFMISELLNKTNSIHLKNDYYIKQIDELWEKLYRYYENVYMKGPYVCSQDVVFKKVITDLLLIMGSRLIQLHEQINSSDSNHDDNFPIPARTNFKRYDVLVIK